MYIHFNGVGYVSVVGGVAVVRGVALVGVWQRQW